VISLGTTSLLILEQHSNHPIRFDGQVYSLSSLRLQPGLGASTSVLFTLIISIEIHCIDGVGFRGRENWV